MVNLCRDMFVVEMYTILNLLLLRGCSDFLSLSRIEILSIGEFYLFHFSILLCIPADHDTTIRNGHSIRVYHHKVSSKFTLPYSVN